MSCFISTYQEDKEKVFAVQKKIYQKDKENHLSKYRNSSDLWGIQ